MLKIHSNDEVNVTQINNMGRFDISSPINSAQSIKLRESFLANLTHDLKSPVFSQIRALKILLDDESANFTPFQREIIEQTFASNVFMYEMLQNVLMKFKIENTRIEIEKSQNNFRDTLNKAIESISFIFGDKKQTVSLSYLTQVEIAFYDEIEIIRVLNNLMTNASKYGDKGGEIQITVEKHARFLTVSVLNNARQIPEEEIENIFNIYSTNSKKHKTTGIGLGLHICRQIIEAHNGKIFAQNVGKDKVKFTFLLPIKG